MQSFNLESVEHEYVNRTFEQKTSTSSQASSTYADMSAGAGKQLDVADHSDGEKGDFPHAYAGMGKDLLLKHSTTRFWKILRNTLLLSFWLTWVVLLAAVVYITITHPRCRIPPPKTWWQTSLIYDVDPRNLPEIDGVGGLKGLKMRLDALTSMHVDTLYIRNPYPGGAGSPTDQRIVDPAIGNLTDLEELVDAAHKRSLKIVLEFVPGHTSLDSDWFKNRPDFYIWEDCAMGNFPNNWLDTTGGVAWTNVSGRCYLHHYGNNNPVLNLRNNRVLKEIDDSLRGWLERGIDGFIMSDVSRLIVDYRLEDEPPSSQLAGDSMDYMSLDHIWTQHLQENRALLNRWRGFVELFSHQSRLRLLAVHVDGFNSANQDIYYRPTTNGGSMLVFNQPPFQKCTVSKPGLTDLRFNITYDPLAITNQLNDLLSRGPVVTCAGNEFGHLNESSYLDAAFNRNFSAIDAMHFETYTTATALRTNATFIFGDQQEVDIPSGTAFTRSLEGQNTYLVVLNDGPTREPLNLGDFSIGDDASVELYSGSSDTLTPTTLVTSGDEIIVDYGEGIVLSWPYQVV